MSDTTTLLYRFLGIDAGASASFDRMAAKTALLGDTSKGAFAKVKMLALGVTAAGVGIAAASIKMAADYQRSMLLIQTQAGASAVEVKNFSKALLGMATEVGTSPDELAKSLYHVYSTGLKGADALRAVKVAAQGAKIGNADLEETTNALTSTIASGIKGAGDFSQAMGTLNAVVGAGDMKLSDLNDALGTGILTAAKVFNVSLQQAGAALAVFGDNNIRGQDAATKLRMAMQDIAQPAAHADKFLARIGLTAVQLRDSLAKHGLTSALDMLAEHMAAAGITAGKVGPFIEQAFTKKAGVGLGILIDQIDRYHQKLGNEAAAAGGFGAAWKATTETAAFAFDRLKTEAEVAMIALGTKLLPVVSDIANWLGNKLPVAVHAVAPLVMAFAHDVGNVLGPAWQVVSVALGAVVVSLHAVVEAASSVKGPLAALATYALATWAAMKMIGLATVIFKGIQTAIILTRVRLLELRGALVAVTEAEVALGVGSLAAQRSVAALGVTLGATGATMAKFAKLFSMFRFAALASVGANQDTASALDQTRKQYDFQTHSADKSAAAMLRWATTTGRATLPIKASLKAVGVGYAEAAAAISGSDAKFKAWLSTVTKGKHVNDEYTGVLKLLHDGYRNTATAATGAAGATKKHADQTKKSLSPTQQAAAAARQLADAVKKLTTNFQDLVNAELGAAQNEDAFKEGLLQVKQSVKDNGHSLSENTQKGLANRDMMLNLLSSAERAAEGSKNYGRALIQNVKQFETFAINAGYSRKSVENLITKMHLMPKQIKSRITLDTSSVSDALAVLTSEAGAVGGRMAANMRASFRDGMGIKSPSRVMQEYGRQIIAGLKLGTKTNVGALLAQGFISGWKDGTSKLKNALSSPVQAAMDKLTKVVTDAIKRQADKLKASRTTLRDLLKQRASDVANLAGSISSGTSLSSLFGTDDQGNPTTANVSTYLTGQAQTIENFAKDLGWARKNGLSTALLSQIAELGAEQGDAVLQQFMSGQSSINTANAAERSIQHYSTAAAGGIENAIYAKRVAADRKAIKENSDELRKLTHALHSAERHTARQAAMHLTIDAKTGKPHVDRKFIDEILKGIREAQRIAGKKLI